MKTRFITGIIGIILLICAVLLNELVFGLVIFLLSIIAMREYLNCFKNTAHKPIKSIAYIVTLVLWPIMVLIAGVVDELIWSPDMNTYSEIPSLMFFISEFGFILCIAMLCLVLPVIFRSDKYNISDVAITLFGIFYVPFLFSFVVLTRCLRHVGLYYVGMIFIGACVTDIFAYLVGCSIGKHKLLPKISPKKTIEGSIGGIVGAVACMVLYGMYLNKHVSGLGMPLLVFALIGLVTSIVSQLGDLFASAIKRYAGIKDYGNILPGHGGILDRFDSIVFTAPVVYFLALFAALMWGHG